MADKAMSLRHRRCAARFGSVQADDTTIRGGTQLRKKATQLLLIGRQTTRGGTQYVYLKFRPENEDQKEGDEEEEEEAPK